MIFPTQSATFVAALLAFAKYVDALPASSDNHVLAARRGDPVAERYRTLSSILTLNGASQVAQHGLVTNNILVSHRYNSLVSTVDPALEAFDAETSSRNQDRAAYRLAHLSIAPSSHSPGLVFTNQIPYKHKHLPFTTIAYETSLRFQGKFEDTIRDFKPYNEWVKKISLAISAAEKDNAKDQVVYVKTTVTDFDIIEGQIIYLKLHIFLYYRYNADGSDNNKGVNGRMNPGIVILRGDSSHLLITNHKNQLYLQQKFRIARGKYIYELPEMIYYGQGRALSLSIELEGVRPLHSRDGSTPDTPDTLALSAGLFDESTKLYAVNVDNDFKTDEKCIWVSASDVFSNSAEFEVDAKVLAAIMMANLFVGVKQNAPTIDEIPGNADGPFPALALWTHFISSSLAALISAVQISSIDVFGTRIDSVVMDVAYQLKEQTVTEQTVTEPVVLRGNSVAIMVLIEYAKEIYRVLVRLYFPITIRRPNFALGSMDFHALPSGTLGTDTNYIVAAIRNLKEQTVIKSDNIRESKSPIKNHSY